MKILQITLGFYPSVALGGPIKVVHQNSLELERRGHQVTVLCTNRLDKQNRIGPRSFEQRLDGLRIVYANTFTLPGWRGVFGPSFAPDLWRWLWREIPNFDLVHLNGYRGEIFLAGALAAQHAQRPYVIQPHGELPYILSSIPLKKLYDILFRSRVFKRASAYLALTPKEVEQCIRAGADRSRVKMLPNGIQLVDIHLPPRGTFRSQLGIRPSEKIVLFLGRIHRKKGLDILVRSFARLDSNARLVVVGKDDGHLGEVKRLVEALRLQDRVLFAGMLIGSEVYRAYVDADIFALTCRTDTFPMALVEASIAGIPVLLSETCEIAYLFDGRAGYAVPLNEADIADCLSNMLSNPELLARLACGARLLAQEQFSVERVVDRLEEVYTSVLHKSV